ncbi:ATP-binding protein [bacterium]|nr:ATP-binding protein [bacterium]
MEVDENNKLKLQFDIHTIEHLGVQMYKTLPPVLSELISNSYDADASNVIIIFDDSNENKTITVTDDGSGMTFEELNDSFLKIGRNRRKYSKDTTAKGRKVTGRKGLGKLAIFGIANKIEVITVKNNLKNVFVMNLQEILSTDKEYNPKVLVHNKETNDITGTTIILRDIQRKSAFDIENLKESISKRFNFVDDDFCIELQKFGAKPQKIYSNTKWEYITPQFEWEFPRDDMSEDQYALSKGITGKIISTEKPLSEYQNGIFLYARGKLVNSNDFFGLKTTTSFAYNYFTGFINVDFIDDYDKDMITTNRDGLTWENEELDSLKQWLKNQLFNIAREWRIKREESKTKEINK